MRRIILPLLLLAAGGCPGETGTPNMPALKDGTTPLVVGEVTPASSTGGGPTRDFLTISDVAVDGERLYVAVGTRRQRLLVSDDRGGTWRLVEASGEIGSPWGNIWYPRLVASGGRLWLLHPTYITDGHWQVSELDTTTWRIGPRVDLTAKEPQAFAARGSSLLAFRSWSGPYLGDFTWHLQTNDLATGSSMVETGTFSPGAAPGGFIGAWVSPDNGQTWVGFTDGDASGATACRWQLPVAARHCADRTVWPSVGMSAPVVSGGGVISVSQRQERVVARHMAANGTAVSLVDLGPGELPPREGLALHQRHADLVPVGVRDADGVFAAVHLRRVAPGGAGAVELPLSPTPCALDADCGEVAMEWLHPVGTAGDEYLVFYRVATMPEGKVWSDTVGDWVPASGHQERLYVRRERVTPVTPSYSPGP